MLYTIERAIANDPKMGWAQSDTYPNQYTLAQANNIILTETFLRYRKVPVVKPAPLRQVTREEFLETLVDEAKERLTLDNIQGYLPFQSSVMSGNTHNHIVSNHVFPIETERRTVRDGETLCGRNKYSRLIEGRNSHSDCPGCLAIARGLAVRDLV